MERPGSVAQPRRIEVSITEARSRLAQFVQIVSLTGQVVLVCDGGRAVAAIVAVDTAQSRAEAATAQDRARAAVAGWARRIEDVRGAVSRQRDDRIRVLEGLLSEAWELLDDRCPSGSDRAVDAARAVYRETTNPPRP
jgi:antitoxin (DNA-binding transcriptional repressor) of toxin-antitoxin stability system